MKYIVAMDSFKGSLSSMEAGNAVKKGILTVDPDAAVVVKPLADGGEGTMEALREGLGGTIVSLHAHGPLREVRNTQYTVLPDRTVVMEMAKIAGLPLVPEEKRNPLYTSTYGLGELIADAVNKGYRNFIIGIGGSATNDGGMGMLQALGYRFSDKEGNDAGWGAQALEKVHHIEDYHSSLLDECTFLVACDVDNPLCGINGATYVFGPQKGLQKAQLATTDEWMNRYADICSSFTDTDYKNMPGSGAAGGLGYAFLTFLHAKLQPGISLVLDAIGLQNELADADCVMTGEGKLDGQTAYGKAPVGVAKLAKQYGCKVLAIAGSIGWGAEEVLHQGIDAYYGCMPEDCSLQEAMKPENAKKNITDTVVRVLETYKKQD
ncbi:MAG: glycerate kinase [Erysipelotrichaceae bacterium]|nr:glycerate kinase [Erysipelotrichaceae bacterium]